MSEIENIALFDMDGTLCDYDAVLSADLEKLRNPDEPIFSSPIIDDAPEYIKARANSIKQSVEWWENLPKLQLGWDILKVAQIMHYRIMILTQAPRTNPNALAGKLRWILKNAPDVDFTMTRDKGLVYGKVLVDDFPGYIKRWLRWRPRGTVIMPASQENQHYSHHQVLRYDGTNLDAVRILLEKAKLR